MYHLRVPVFLLVVLVLLRCIAAAPSHRNFSPSSSDDEQENALPAKGGLTGARLQRRLTAPNSHRLQKRICNLSTCLTHNLGEMLMNNVRGTPKTPMNVGPKSFGKRDIQPPGFLPF
ncbi:PREDICTED: calcitonin gene-related peptide 2-like [Poecilia mexicana]|uniref:calcitonin gene-related peptide 2-like n=1 Tax=Poecilia mexicana TaxID=48701 RepID=UPI00072E7E8C|nr:PREDICTED: calcitonin gene-related peptide 2-like [Poecilia mexicana]